MRAHPHYCDARLYNTPFAVPSTFFLIFSSFVGQPPRWGHDVAEKSKVTLTWAPRSLSSYVTGALFEKGHSGVCLRFAPRRAPDPGFRELIWTSLNREREREWRTERKQLELGRSGWYLKTIFTYTRPKLAHSVRVRQAAAVAGVVT